MSDTVRAAVIPAPGREVELREMRVPALEPDSALLRVLSSEVCGTDLHLRDGLLAGVPYPLIPGHVTVGRIEKLRGSMRTVDGTAVQEGDRVTFLDVHRTCNVCWYCAVAKASTRCPSRRVYGITYGADDGLAGGWAEAVYLRPGTRVLPLGDADPQRFMAGGCGLPTAIHAIERAEIGIADSVLILGAGPVGLSLAALARVRGAGTVLVVGAPSARLEVARAVGADATIDFRERELSDLLEWVRAHTDGRGADVVIEASGAPDAVVTGLRAARDAGRLVVVGQYTDRGEARFNPHSDLNAKHLEVRASWGSDFSHFHRAIEITAHPDLGQAWSKVPLQRFRLDRAAEAMAAVGDGSAVKALITPDGDA